MPPANDVSTALRWLIILIVIFLAILLLVGLVSFYNEFSRELRYINSEIARTVGSERRYWLQQRRKLWLSLIPFVRY